MALQIRGKFSWGARSSRKNNKTKLYVRTHRLRSADILPGYQPRRARYLCFTKNEFSNLLATVNSDITSRLNHLEIITEHTGIAAAKIREHIKIKASEIHEAQIDYFTEEHFSEIRDALTREDFVRIKQAADIAWYASENDHSNSSTLGVDDVIQLSLYLDVHYRDLMATFINAGLY